MMGDDRTSLIRVTNNNPFAVNGRFSGKDYVFKPGVGVDIPQVMAWHIFDFGKEDKTQCLMRFGWARTSEDVAAGLQKLNKIVFDDPPEMVEVVKPKRVKKDAPATDKETGAAGPPVTAGGTEGGALKAPPNGPKIGETESALVGEDQETF